MYMNVCATDSTSASEIRSRVCIFKLAGVGLFRAAWDALWAVVNGLWVQALLPVAHCGGWSLRSTEGQPGTETQRGLPRAGMCYSLSQSPQPCLLFLELRGNFS